MGNFRKIFLFFFNFFFAIFFFFLYMDGNLPIQTQNIFWGLLAKIKAAHSYSPNIETAKPENLLRKKDL